MDSWAAAQARVEAAEKAAMQDSGRAGNATGQVASGAVSSWSGTGSHTPEQQQQRVESWWRLIAWLLTVAAAALAVVVVVFFVSTHVIPT